jgi:c-di-AMP phosphodiesterase-like protein
MDVRPCQLMLNLKTDDGASFPVLNGLGFIFGLVSVVALFVQQSLTTLLPLLVPLVVCVVLCTVLIKSQQKTNLERKDISQSPVRVDVI